MQSKKLPAAPQALLYWVLLALVVVAFGWVLTQQARRLTPSTVPSAGLAALIVLTAASSLAALARQLPWQNVLAATTVAAGIGSAACLVSIYSGVPFGPFEFGGAAGERLGRLPWTVPFLWVIVFFTARGVARLILRPWRKIKSYGYYLIGGTALLGMAFDLGMDPFLGRINHFWLWWPTRFPVTWQQAPLLNFVGWAVVLLLILAFATPVLIKKQPGPPSAPDYHPLGIWLGAMGLFATAAGGHGLWAAMVLDAILGGAVAVVAVKGGRW